MEKPKKHSTIFSKEVILDRLLDNEHIPAVLSSGSKCEVKSNNLNILGRIFPDFEKHWHEFGNLSNRDVQRIKKQAVEATDKLRNECFVPFFSDGKQRTSKRIREQQKIWTKKTTQLVSKDYESVDEMIQAFMLTKSKIYDPTVIYKCLFFICYYVGLKQFYFNQKEFPELIEPRRNTATQTIQNLSGKQNLFDVTIEDITINEEQKRIFNQLTIQLLGAGKDESEKALLEKIIERSSWSSREKELISSVKKIFKKPDYLKLLVRNGSFGDQNGIRIGFYELQQAKDPLKQLIHIIRQSNTHTVLKETPRGLLGEAPDEHNPDSSQEIFPEHNMVIGNMYGQAVVEVQFGLHPKIIYDKVIQGMIDSNMLKFKKDKKEQNVHISHVNSQDFRSYLIRYVNDIQHQVYKIQNNWRFAHQLVPKEYFEYAQTHRTYDGKEAFLYQQFESSRKYISTKLKQDLNNPSIKEYLLKHSLHNQNGLNIIFPDFTKMNKASFHTAISNALLNELGQQAHDRGKAGKKIQESDALLLRLVSKMYSKNRENATSISEELLVDKKKRRKK